MIEQTRATRATRPMVRPTAAPVVSPPLLDVDFSIDAEFCEFGGTVGVTVIVRTCPVTVSRDKTGVGVHVDELEVFPAVGLLAGGSVVPGCRELVGDS